MMRSLIRRNRTPKIEHEPQHESLPRSERIEIFGSNLSGSSDLRRVMREFLEDYDLSRIDVQSTRYVESIEDSFYGRKASPDGTQWAEPPFQTLAEYLADAAVPEEVTPPQDTIPAGVIVLREMRMEAGMYNMTIPSPVEYIQELCDQHGVPMVYLESLNDLFGDKELIKQLLPINN